MMSIRRFLVFFGFLAAGVAFAGQPSEALTSKIHTCLGTGIFHLYDGASRHDKESYSVARQCFEQVVKDAGNNPDLKGVKDAAVLNLSKLDRCVRYYTQLGNKALQEFAPIETVQHLYDLGIACQAK